MASIFVYSVDSAVARRIFSPLRKENYKINFCDIGELLPLEQEEFPLVLLDARLKWSACRPLFEKIQAMNCPVIFFTADRRMLSHLRALYNGPSDVLTLPFAPKTLLDKVAEIMGTEAPLGELTVSEDENMVLLNGERVELTAQEFALLLALMEDADKPVSREQLLYKAWGYQSMGDTRTVDVHVQRLRRKLGGERIETVYKCGYRLKMA